ncbi:hypothetical protein P3592_19015 [Vibrio parahaemolyticus]|uniref:hypothetical protein n=1 Tax=Vibrio parahaemolyticus TaxID=670 RepID=UPI00111F5134|nr:hypothetical protein [Vibrio parahaemolyticus]MDF4802921.1 hypothetical protein [Vibrio parahaemolyticus]MDF4810618.1 hypothetical protein [Vibrio parahaemolyticus]MDF4853868.1 hypothetical protein [Vibrio parahaemolyticus]TOQ18800.1 hypothetical protein CGH00_22845 [Vibrio parahaemolyticus]HCG5913970.1 hypothetical protein [Vibrio parahaemolyticus]
MQFSIKNIMLLLVMLLHFGANATDSSAKDAIGEFLKGAVEQYVSNGTDGIDKKWQMTIGVDKSPFLTSLKSIEGYYGAVVDYDIVNITPVSDRVSIAYVALNYEKGAAFLRVQLYRTHEGGVIILYANVHTEAYQIMPSLLTVKP